VHRLAQLTVKLALVPEMRHHPGMTHEPENLTTKPSLEDVVRRAKARNVPLPPLAIRRALRLEAGLTQDEAALVLSVNRATVARWELGTRNPSGANRKAYASVLRSLAGISDV